MCAMTPSSLLMARVCIKNPIEAMASNQRQKDQDDPKRRHVPYKGAKQKNPSCVQGEIDDTRPEIELSTPLGHPTVCGSNIRREDGCSEQRERLDEIAQRAVSSARHSGQLRHRLVPGTRRPYIAALQACSMRGQYDLYQPEDDAEGEHLEFKCH